MKNQSRTYSMYSATLNPETEQEILVKTNATTPVSYMVLGFIFLAIAIVLIWGAGSSGILFSLTAISFAVLMFSQSVNARAVFDFQGRAIHLSFSQWFGLRKVEKDFAMDALVAINQGANTLTGERIGFLFADGNILGISFPRKTNAAQLLQMLTGRAQAGYFPALNSPDAAGEAAVSETKSLMARELRSWQLWLVVIAIGQMVAAKGFSPWGGLLIVVALASLYFAEAGMFAIFLVTVAWAGISNLLSGTGIWGGMAILQFFMAFQIFKQFQRFLRIEKAEGTQNTSRAARVFPWVALFLGPGSLLAFLIMFVGIFANALTIKSDTINSILTWADTFSIYSALIGLSTGLAGWVASYPRKWASVIGVVASGLTLLAQLGFALLALLG